MAELPIVRAGMLRNKAIRIAGAGFIAAAAAGAPRLDELLVEYARAAGLEGEERVFWFLSLAYCTAGRKRKKLARPHLIAAGLLYGAAAQE